MCMKEQSQRLWGKKESLWPRNTQSGYYDWSQVREQIGRRVGEIRDSLMKGRVATLA